MNHTLKEVYRLSKYSFHCKRSIKQCLKQDVRSPAYRLAQKYEQLLYAIEESPSLTLTEIEAVIAQIEQHSLNDEQSVQAQRLTTHMLGLFQSLKPLARKHYT